jgi:hypothetical protein
MTTHERIEQSRKKHRYKYRYKKKKRYRRSWVGLSKWQRGMIATLIGVLVVAAFWLFLQLFIYAIMQAS